MAQENVPDLSKFGVPDKVIGVINSINSPKETAEDETKTDGTAGKLPTSFLGVMSKLNLSELNAVLNVAKEEAGGLVMDARMRSEAEAELGEEGVAGSWQTAADMIRHLDLAELSQKHPEEAKTVAVKVLSVLGMFFGPANLASKIVSAVPPEALAKAQGAGLSVTPSHMASLIAQHQAKKEAERQAGYLEDGAPKEEKRKMILVCGDELLCSYLQKRLSELEPPVRLLRWSEDKWAWRCAKDTLPCPALVVDGGKTAKNGSRLMEVGYETFGVRFGIFGKTAFLEADPKKLQNKADYAEFLSLLAEKNVPAGILRDARMKMNVKTGLKLAFATPLIAKDAVESKKELVRQQLFFGAAWFCEHDLASMLEAEEKEES